MGKPKKEATNQNRSTPKSDSQRNSVATKKSVDTCQETKKEIDLITSRLIDLCGQKPGAQSATAKVLWSEHLEIRRQVDQLRKLQTSTTAEIFPEEKSNRIDRLSTMVDWCDRNGLRSDGVSLTAFENQQGETNFGIRVDRNLEPGELVVNVLRKLFLSLENGLQRNGDFRSIFSNDPLLSGMPNVALSFLVVVEKAKGSDSFWKPYLDSLPTSYETPLTFLVENEKLIENLRGSIAFEETMKLYKNIVRQYSYFYQMISSESPGFAVLGSKLLQAKKFVFDLYLWATVTVMTRINLVPAVEGGARNGEMVPALIPFFDMANHGDVPPCTDFIDDDEGTGRQSAVIYASKSYQAQDQLLIFYGERKFWEFFVHNGFLYDDGRRCPNVVVKLGLSNSDRLLALKDTALQRFGMLPSEQFLISKYADDDDGPFPHKMQKFALIFCSDEEELRSFCRDESTPDQFEWSTKTSDEARRFLVTRLSLLLRMYANVNEEAESAISGARESTIDERRIGLIWKFIEGETDSLKKALAFLERQ